MTSQLAYLCSSESWGGLEMNHLRNALWMQERGHAVFILCIEDSRSHQEAQALGLKTVFVQKHKKYYDFAAGKKLVELLKKHHISHLLLRSTRDLSIAAYAKSKLKSKLHTSYFMEMQLGVRKTNLLHSLRFRGIDLWACPLPWLETQVRTMTRFTNELALIPSGLQLDQYASILEQGNARQQLNLPDDALLFGLMGRFDVQKGQLLLLEAMKLASDSSFEVVLLGEPTHNEGDEYFQKMQDFIEQNELEDRVHIRPYMKNPAVFYAAIDWFVMATKAETFGMVTIESLACGTPVLGSNAGGTPELVGENGGVLFETLNPADLGAKIAEICSGNVNITSSKLKEIASKYDHNLVCELVEKHLKLY